MSGDASPGWFLVTSPGRTATYWLAWSLSQHPDIVCSHGNHFPPDIVTFDKDGRAELDPAHPAEPIRSIYDIPDMGALGVGPEGLSARQDNFNSKTVSEYLDAHRMFGDSAVIGNVHGYTLGNLRRRLAAETPDRTISVINLIRHPVDQILSFVSRHQFDAARSDDYKQARLNLAGRHEEVTGEVGALFHVDFDDFENMNFLTTALQVSNMQQDILIEDVEHIPFEELTRSPAIFRKVLARITGGADFRVGPTYIEQVFEQGPMNYSVTEKQPVEDVFAALQDWQKFLIRNVMTEEVTIRYSEYGYDMRLLE